MKNPILQMAAAAFLLSSLTGCLSGSFDGSLKVSSTLYAYVKGKTVAIPPGTYDPAYVTGKQFLFSKYISLGLNMGGKRQTIDIQVPGNIEIPSRGGTIRIPSATGRQPFDLAATFDAAVVTNGPRESGYESCTYETCTEESCDENGNNCSRHCTTWDGRQYVEYHMQRTVQHVSSTITAPGKSAVLAKYRGTSDNTAKVYDVVGDCN